MVKSFNNHPEVPGSIPGEGMVFKKSQILLIIKGFQIFWQKAWNQQLLFYYSMRRGSVVKYSDSKLNTGLPDDDDFEKMENLALLRR